ncbi:hypothetical protein [Armatimonas sp.]|uniref:hypothetical protein n=1 Tax=Armatimonas sp. TaxID=1872638 RepID=UPI00286A4918|nr:hypothetical protein [Armatimonas sp.]
MLLEPLQVVQRLIETFDRLGIAYLVGGSVASSVVGVERATQDVDFVVALMETQVEALTQALADEFYADADLLREAILHDSSANVIHLPTMIKADLFISPDTAFAHSQMERRLRLPLLGEGAPLVCVTSPEDMILQKLRWYRLTGERSEKQWGDVQGIFRIQQAALDQSYLTDWAKELELTDLLVRAREEAGVH